MEANWKYTAAYQSNDIAEQLQVTVYKSPAGRPVHPATIKAKFDSVLCSPPA